ncbi:MAG: hypothetical protein AB7F43_13065 [Bacteriovoracia bacterium]
MAKKQTGKPSKPVKKTVAKSSAKAPINVAKTETLQQTAKMLAGVTAAPSADSAGLEVAGAKSVGQTEEAQIPLTPKNFRNQPDMESFFRFIYENDLRLEALQIIDEVLTVRRAKRKKD